MVYLHLSLFLFSALFLSALTEEFECELELDTGFIAKNGTILCQFLKLIINALHTEPVSAQTLLLYQASPLLDLGCVGNET